MIVQNHKKKLWNCRGAASPAFFRYCKQYMEVHHPEIVVIMELRVDPWKLQKTFILLGFDGFLCSDGRGFAGGIVVA